MESTSRFRAGRDVVVAVASIALGVAMVWIPLRQPAASPVSSPPPVPERPLSIDQAATMGAASAPVVLIMFSDFECPFCAKFTTDILPWFKTRFVDSGEVQVVFRHWPLPIHSRAEKASEAAVCAQAQQGFWPMHDSLFGAAGKLEGTDLVEYARRANLDTVAFETCMRDSGPAVVRRDVELAVALKLQGTPTFLFGSRRADGRVKITNLVVGPGPREQFEDAVRIARGANVSATIAAEKGDMKGR